MILSPVYKWRKSSSKRLIDLVVIIQPLSKKATVKPGSARHRVHAPPHCFPVMLPQGMGQPLLVEPKHRQGGQSSEEHGKFHDKGCTQDTAGAKRGMGSLSPVVGVTEGFLRELTP